MFFLSLTYFSSNVNFQRAINSIADLIPNQDFPTEHPSTSFIISDKLWLEIDMPKTSKQAIIPPPSQLNGKGQWMMKQKSCMNENLVLSPT